MNEMKKQMHKLTTTAIMAKVMVPFLETRKGVLKAMQEAGLTFDEAIEIMDEVCTDAVKVTDWADKNKIREIDYTNPNVREDYLLKALREIEGVSKDELSDEDARRLIKEAMSEFKDMKDIGVI